MFKGKICFTKEGVSILHTIIDPYSQLTNPILIHPDNKNSFELDEIVNFDIVLEKDKHYAKLSKVE